jgi:hypothetical protein
MSSPGARRKRFPAARAVCIALLALLIWAALPNGPLLSRRSSNPQALCFCARFGLYGSIRSTLQESVNVSIEQVSRKV